MGGRIVVGVDGSDGSVLALRWAYQEAALRGAALEVIHAWQYPYVGDLAGMATYAIPHQELEDGARQTLARTIEQAGATPPGVEITETVTHGAPATVLLEAAKGADLLVVGSRGRGGFAGLLLGSVSQQCAHHAPGPLAIVPHTWQPA